MTTDDYLCLRLGLRPNEIPPALKRRQRGPYILQIRLFHHAGEKSLNMEITGENLKFPENNRQSICYMTNPDIDRAMLFVGAITSNAKEIKRLALKSRGVDWKGIWSLLEKHLKKKVNA